MYFRIFLTTKNSELCLRRGWMREGASTAKPESEVTRRDGVIGRRGARATRKEEEGEEIMG